MKKIIVISLFFLLAPFISKALAFTASQINGITHYNFSDGTSGTASQINGITHYNFSDPVLNKSYDLETGNKLPTYQYTLGEYYSNDGLTLINNYCNGLSSTKYPNWTSRGIELTTECLQDICPPNGCDMSEYQNGLSKCTHEGPEKALKEILGVCVKEQAKKYIERVNALLENDKDNRIKNINIYADSSKKSLLIRNVYSDIETSLKKSSIYIDWSTNDLKDISGFYVYFGNAATLSNDLSQYQFTTKNGLSFNNLKKGNYNLYFKLKYKDGYVSPVKYIMNITSENQGNITNSINSTFSKRQIGKILLQVESHGEAWYVNPKTSKRHYMADGNEAYRIMRYLGVGITNKDLDKVKSDKSFAKQHSGKIFLQVEASGEAFYIDMNGNNHYLKDGSAAYEVMRSLGLGITNNDLSRIPEGNL